MAKSKSSGLASFILFLAAILQLLNVYAAETDIDSSRSFAKPVMSSVTAEFIQFLRQHEQVFQAVEQIAAEDEDEMNAQEEDTQLSQGDVSVLQSGQGSARVCKIFRPDSMNVGIVTSIVLHITADMALHTVRMTICQTWPDLRPPTVQWCLLAIHGTIMSSIHIESGMEAFMLQTGIDLGPGQVPVMYEFQRWNLLETRYHSYLEPQITIHAQAFPGCTEMLQDIHAMLYLAQLHVMDIIYNFSRIMRSNLLPTSSTWPCNQQMPSQQPLATGWTVRHNFQSFSLELLGWQWQQAQTLTLRN